MFNGAQAKRHLHLVYDGASRAHDESDETVPNSSDSSVPPFRSPPNGVKKEITEEATEQGKKLIEQFREGSVGLRSLYRALKDLWGIKTFEDTRHCFENMKQRAKDGYADLDPSFELLPEFLYHMGPRPEKEYSIHRRDNSKGYSPDNCVWADKKTQSRERNNTVELTSDGETLPLTEWAERLGVSPNVLRKRRGYGWSDEDVIHGRPEEGTYRVPPDAPWPGNTKVQWEVEFRLAGGRSRDERLLYLMKRSKEKLVSLWRTFNYDWDTNYEPTPEEQIALDNWNADYERIRAFYRSARRELQQRYRFDLVQRCKDRSLDKLFDAED